MNRKQLHARKRRQFKLLCKQLNRLLQGEHTINSKKKIETITLKIKYLLRELSGIIARWEMKKTLGAAAIMFGLATAPLYGQYFAEPVIEPFGLLPNEDVNKPAFVDLDNDGDMDILAGVYYNGTTESKFVYYENIGTESEPSFGAGQANPFGLQIATSDFITPTLVDIDNDGDMDLFIGTYKDFDGVSEPLFKYYENIGTASTPQFDTALDNPFGIVLNFDGYAAIPAFADFDSDGDMDMLVATPTYDYANERYENFQYFKNTGTAANPEFAAPITSAFGLIFPPSSSFVSSLPAIADLDSDGDLDILSSLVGYTYESNGTMEYGGAYYFENIGSATNPQYTISERNPLGITFTPGMIDKGSIIVPALADLDNDGDIDMLSGAWYGAFHYYENIENPVSNTIVEFDFSITLSPNPVNDYLSISTNEKLIKIEIYDLSGKQLATYNGQQTQISLQSLASGVYMIRLVNHEGFYTSRKIEKI